MVFVKSLGIEAQIKDKVQFTFQISMTKHWIIKKTSQSHNFLKVKNTFTRRPSHSNIHCTFGMWPRKQNDVQNTMIRLSLFMTLYCINQAGSCLEVITMTKIRYARTATSAWPRITSRRTEEQESERVRWNPTHSEHTLSHFVDVSRDVSRQSSDWKADRKDVGEFLLELDFKWRWTTLVTLSD